MTWGKMLEKSGISGLVTFDTEIKMHSYSGLSIPVRQ
jgi:hypothetical protein